MRRYETVMIFDPDVGDEERQTLFDRFRTLVEREGGYLAQIDEWGQRKMAYAIKKKPRGYYVRLDYCGEGALVDEIERFCRIDDRLLKYLTVMLDKDADVEEVKAEVARAAAQKEAEARSDVDDSAPPAAAEQNETEKEAS